MSSDIEKHLRSALAPAHSATGRLLRSDDETAAAASSFWGYRTQTWEQERTLDLVRGETAVLNALTARTEAYYGLLKATSLGAIDLVHAIREADAEHEVRKGQFRVAQAALTDREVEYRLRTEERLEQRRLQSARSRLAFERECAPTSVPAPAFESPRRQYPPDAMIDVTPRQNRVYLGDPEQAVRLRQRDRQYQELDEVVAHEVATQRRLAATEAALVEEFGPERGKAMYEDIRRRSGFTD